MKVFYTEANHSLWFSSCINQQYLLTVYMVVSRRRAVVQIERCNGLEIGRLTQRKCVFFVFLWLRFFVRCHLLQNVVDSETQFISVELCFTDISASKQAEESDGRASWWFSFGCFDFFLCTQHMRKCRRILQSPVT